MNKDTLTAWPVIRFRPGAKIQKALCRQFSVKISLFFFFFFLSLYCVIVDDTDYHLYPTLVKSVLTCLSLFYLYLQICLNPSKVGSSGHQNPPLYFNKVEATSIVGPQYRNQRYKL